MIFDTNVTYVTSVTPITSVTLRHNVTLKPKKVKSEKIATNKAAWPKAR
jgi:hypothetical protein